MLQVQCGLISLTAAGQQRQIAAVLSGQQAAIALIRINLSFKIPLQGLQTISTEKYLGTAPSKAMALRRDAHSIQDVWLGLLAELDWKD